MRDRSHGVVTAVRTRTCVACEIACDSGYQSRRALAKLALGTQPGLSGILRVERKEKVSKRAGEPSKHSQ